MNQNRTHRWLGFVAVGLMAATLAGCGGDDPTGPQGTPGSGGDPGVAGPPGPPGATGNVNAAFITPQEWAAAQFVATVDSVSTSGKPVVEFKVVDNQGRPVQGLETITSKSSTATVAQYPNVSFAIAKLMPRTDARPASWVSYIVTDAPTTACANTLPARPGTDNIGKLEAVADKPGSYKYTFYRDVSRMKDDVAALPERPTDPKDPCFAVRSGTPQYPAPSKTDLGDLTWQPDLPHRLTIQIGGSAPGTGSNTPNGVQAAPAVDMANPVNVTYDFVPASGRVLLPSELTREDVSIDNCNVCHGKLAFHGGSARVETRYCVVCHTDQRGYGQLKATSTRDIATNGFDSITFPKLTETARADAITGIISFSYKPDTAVADGEVAGNFTTMIHKIHQGHTLVKQNYHYAGAAFNLKGFSKLGDGQKMCTTCHGGADATTANNFNQIPSRKACGACHDGIKWDTGTGSTLGDKMKVVFAADPLPSTGHLGGAYQDDGTCKSCHTSDNIKISHRTENITKNNPQITAGLASFEYEIKSATMNGTDLIVEFGIWTWVSPDDSSKKTLVTFVPPAASFPALAPGVAGGPLQPGLSGSPSFLLPYAQKQDDIAKPADYNNLGRSQAQPRSVSITTCLTTGSSGTCTLAPSTGGYYTATIKSAYPPGALMRAVALQGYFNQVTAPASLTASNGRHAISVIKAVNGDAERRTVADAKKCAGCHEWIEAHGGNRVAEPQVCVACHVPGLATSGRGIPDTVLNPFTFNIAQSKILNDWKLPGWQTAIARFDPASVNTALNFPVTSHNFKDLIHGIHAGRDRVSPMQIARDSTSRGVIELLDFRRMDFPGKLNNCETCHVTATGSTTNYNTIPSGSLASTYESVNWTYYCAAQGKGYTAPNLFCDVALATATPAMAKASLAQANLTDTVSTPFTAACVSCHDNSSAKAHMAINGGQLNVTRSTALPAGRALQDVESCAVCHGPGREFDTAKVHK